MHWKHLVSSSSGVMLPCRSSALALLVGTDENIPLLNNSSFVVESCWQGPYNVYTFSKKWSVRETLLTSIFFSCKTYCGDPTERSIERSCHSWSGFTTFDITCAQQAPWKHKLARARLAVTSKLFKSWCMPQLVNWLDWLVQALISVSKYRCEMVTEMESPLNQQFFIVCTGASSLVFVNSNYKSHLMLFLSHCCIYFLPLKPCSHF